MIVLVVVCADALSATFTVSSEPQAILIDHNCVDVLDIPPELLEPAASLRILMRHASVGTGINWGLECMAGAKSTNASCKGFPADKYYRSNWILEQRAGNWKDKMDDLVAQVVARTNDFDIFMTKLCYIDALGESHPDWDYCRNTMEQLEADYPDKRFVWWTIPLTRDGMPGTDWFNEKVRTYCAANNKILFDIADIECYNLSGVRLTNAEGNETISAEYTNEIHAGHLNIEARIRVAAAMWHLITQLAANHQTIQSAIDAATNGDIVIVKPGAYDRIDFKGKSIVVRSCDPTNWSSVRATRINARSSEDWAVKFTGTEAQSCMLAGFRIGGYISGQDPGVSKGTHATIDYCDISGNETSSGQILTGYSGTISNCLITDNQTTPHNLGAALITAHEARFRNCTIANNSNPIYIKNGTATMENTIVTYEGEVIDGYVQVWSGATLNVSCCNVKGGKTNIYVGDSTSTLSWGKNSVDVDASFADPSNGDYHLTSQAGRWNPNSRTWVQDDVTSPCIDAGDPASPIGHEPFPNGGIINMGAYGGTAEASKSYFGGPICETVVSGDINGDCKVDFLDFSILAVNWMQGDVL